jgi:hypothetical protein
MESEQAATKRARLQEVDDEDDDDQPVLSQRATKRLVVPGEQCPYLDTIARQVPLPGWSLKLSVASALEFTMLLSKYILYFSWCVMHSFERPLLVLPAEGQVTIHYQMPRRLHLSTTRPFLTSHPTTPHHACPSIDAHT